jgi:hypothetical protein
VSDLLSQTVVSDVKYRWRWISLLLENIPAWNDAIVQIPTTFPGGVGRTYRQIRSVPTRSEEASSRRLEVRGDRALHGQGALPA